MERRKKVMNEKGFTLIEIIAVLVILAIMAAVAIPKYLNMQQQAANNAAAGACAAAASNASMVYANSLINGSPINNSSQLVTALNVASYNNLGDYNVTYTAGTGTVAVNIVVAPTLAGATAPTANNTKALVLQP
jgi:prepilin-type N-terminal cleavage/methylation domain-containing protein